MRCVLGPRDFFLERENSAHPEAAAAAPRPARAQLAPSADVILK
jgi:hypothetical protein